MNKGFTLIELLIVIAIIGILVAAIAPKYAGFSQDAKESVTQSGLSVIREALTVYVGKNEGSYPSSAGDLSALVPTYIQQLPENKLTGTNAVGSNCSTSRGWAYDGSGIVKACCNSATPTGCSSSGGNATW